MLTRLQPVIVLLLLLVILVVTAHPAYDLDPATVRSHNAGTIGPHRVPNCWLASRALAYLIALQSNSNSAFPLQNGTCSDCDLLETECTYRC